MNIYEAIADKVSRTPWAIKIAEGVETEINLADNAVKNGGIKYPLVISRPGFKSILLEERDAFIWRQLIKGKTIEEINVEYYFRYKKFGVDYIKKTLNYLHDNGYLEGDTDVYRSLYTRARAVSSIEYVFQLLGRLINPFVININIPGANRFYDVVYRILTPFFTRGFVSFIHFISLSGFAYIAWQLALGDFTVTGENLLFSGALVLVINAISIFLHETAHALVARHYGINLTNVGFRLFLGYPVFYVDTTAAWKLPRQQRINISAAGVLTNFLVTGYAGIAIAFLGDSALPTIVLSQMVLVNIVFLVVNLLPFIEFDGYYILIDLLKEPDLRTRSMKVLIKMLKGEKLRRKDSALLAIFAIMSIVSSLGVIWLAWLFWSGFLSHV